MCGSLLLLFITNKTITTLFPVCETRFTEKSKLNFVNYANEIKWSSF